MLSYFDGLLRYFEFSGRSTRTQYWMFMLFSTITSALAVAGDIWFGGVSPLAREWGPLMAFAGLIHLVPSISVTVRRLHDTGRSGWWYLLNFIPFGFIVVLVWMCSASEEYTNQYGSQVGSHGTSRSPELPRVSTIPREIRMGTNAPRPAHVREGTAPQRFI